MKEWAARQSVPTVDAALEFCLGEQPPAHAAAVCEVFEELDGDCDGYLYFRDVAARLNVRAHPLVAHGVVTQRVVSEYLNTWMSRGKHISLKVGWADGVDGIAGYMERAVVGCMTYSYTSFC